ncbi:hypothetical protein TNCV_669301 [Trichonephila clavipes]|nr:hypothetical protein TNCV_669301 [Trichonephila clavipes]
MAFERWCVRIHNRRDIVLLCALLMEPIGIGCSGAPSSIAEVAFCGNILPTRIMAQMLDKHLSQERSRSTGALFDPHQ